MRKKWHHLPHPILCLLKQFGDVYAFVCFVFVHYTSWCQGKMVVVLKFCLIVEQVSLCGAIMGRGPQVSAASWVQPPAVLNNAQSHYRCHSYCSLLYWWERWKGPLAGRPRGECSAARAFAKQWNLSLWHHRCCCIMSATVQPWGTTYVAGTSRAQQALHHWHTRLPSLRRSVDSHHTYIRCNNTAMRRYWLCCWSHCYCGLMDCAGLNAFVPRR